MKMKFLFLVIVVVSGTANSAYSQNYVDSLNAARRASNNGQYRKALKYYKSTERIKPKDLDLSQEMGQTAYKAGDYETAKRCFDNLSANSKSSKERSNHLTDSGISSLGSEDYKGAEETFKDALRENPNNEKARQLLMEAKRKRKQKECQNNSGGEENKQDGQQGQNGQQQQGQGNQQEQGQQQQGGNQGQNSQGDNKQNSKNKGKPKPGDSKNGKPGDGNLQDRQTERRLDELMKQEADARRRMNGNNGTSENNNAEKDW
jgi:Ca-activated chloride channel homolog